jgi:ABC-type branched-subunit amino acid transport system substrate-binding protein
MRAHRAAFAVLSAAVLLVGGCTAKAPHPATSAPAGVQLFGTDGNMFDTLGEAFKDPDAISGMVGTAPLTPLTEDFKQRLKGVDPSLKQFGYAAESYDAVVISALAVQLAHTTDPLIVAKYINGVTTLQPGGVECATIKACLDTIAAGKDIAYRGMAVKGGFTDVGEPSVASYGTLHFSRGDKIDTGQTEFVAAGTGDAASKQPPPDPATGKYQGPPLALGILLTNTGELATTAPPIWAGAHLAVKEFNAAGGALGKPIEYEDADDGTDPAKASASFDKLAKDGASIVIGPNFSGGAVAVIPKAIQAGRIVFSPSATSPKLTTFDDHGMFFRSAPSDAFQSDALADVIMRGGGRRVFLIAREDPYGTGLRDGVSAALVKAGVKKTDIDSRTYPPDAKDFTEIAHTAHDFGPDAIMVAGFDESAKVIAALQAAGIVFSRAP